MGHFHFTKTSRQIIQHRHPSAPPNHIHGMTPQGAWARTRTTIEAKREEWLAMLKRDHDRRRA